MGNGYPLSQMLNIYFRVMNLNYGKSDIHRTLTTGETPIFAAAGGGHHACIRLLAAANSDVNVCDRNGTSPLCMATWKGHEEAVKELIAHGGGHRLAAIVHRGE